MNRMFTVDEIIDQNAFNVTIHKHVSELTPFSIDNAEQWANNYSKFGPIIWWCEIDNNFCVTVYIFENLEDYNKFKKLNSNLKFKINFIPWAEKLES